jgi:quercetin dioxygenase-like cupin family protein
MRKFLSAVMLLGLAASTVAAQDPVKADPKHFKAEFENDQVRVLRFHGDPHGKIPMHDHSVPRVTVSLTDEHTKTTSPEGKVTETNAKAGEATWNDSGKHTSENLSDKAVEEIQVEIKGKPGAKPAAMALDPVKVDPKHFKVVLENDRVRVLRSTGDPHGKLAMHEHPARVTVYLTELHNRSTTPDGKTQDTDRKKGEVTWSAAQKHSSENLGDKPTVNIQIELK